MDKPSYLPFVSFILMFVLFTYYFEQIIYFRVDVKKQNAQHVYSGARNRCNTPFRQEFIIDQCRRLNVTEKRGPHMYDHILVDDLHKVLYCNVPKAGCSSVKYLLLQDRPGINKTLLREQWWTVHDTKLLRNLSEFTDQEAQRKLDDYRKLLILRNPFSRLYSAYVDKIISPFHSYGLRNMFRELMDKLYPKAKVVNGRRYITFQQFANMITVAGRTDKFQSIDLKPLQVEPHWMSQFKLCLPCSIRYDYIAKIETIADDKQQLLAMFNATEFPTVNAASSRGKNIFNHTILGVTEAYRRISREIQDNLRKFYGNDLALFGYDFRSDVGPTCTYPESNCC